MKKLVLSFVMFWLVSNPLIADDTLPYGDIYDEGSEAVFHSYFDCDCNVKSCCPPALVPTMIGDGGLISPRANVFIGGGQIVFQRHISKVAENNAAVPQDRIGFNFNMMPRVYQGTDPTDNNDEDDIFEYRVFAEKTFFDNLVSFDIMVPLYYTSDTNISNLDYVLTGPATDGAMGDLAFGTKLLLIDRPNWKSSIGLRVEAPTSDRIVAQTNLFFTTFNDDVWNFTPYVTGLWQPSDRLFVQSFLSYRMNTGAIDRGVFTAIREQDYLMADMALGYWLKERNPDDTLTGLVSSLELHYTGAMNDESPLNTINNQQYGRTDYLNMTVGSTAYLGDRWSIAAGVGVPLRDNPTTVAGYTLPTDRTFDWALFLNLNYYFGR